MKVLSILFLLFIFSLNLVAQDTIYPKDNQEIIAKILEVDKTSITYKKFDYQDGPSFTIEKIDLIKVIYQNGDIETFTEVPNKTEYTPQIDEPILIEKSKRKDRYYTENRTLLVRDLKYQLLKNQNHPSYETIKLNVNEYSELFSYGRKKKRNGTIFTLIFLSTSIACTGVMIHTYIDDESIDPLGRALATISAVVSYVGFGISLPVRTKGQKSLNNARDKMEKTITLYNSGL